MKLLVSNPRSPLSSSQLIITDQRHSVDRPGYYVRALVKVLASSEWSFFDERFAIHMIDFMLWSSYSSSDVSLLATDPIEVVHPDGSLSSITSHAGDLMLTRVDGSVVTFTQYQIERALSMVPWTLESSVSIAKNFEYSRRERRMLGRDLLALEKAEPGSDDEFCALYSIVTGYGLEHEHSRFASLHGLVTEFGRIRSAYV